MLKRCFDSAAFPLNAQNAQHNDTLQTSPMILVVDDDLAMRVSLQLLLKQAGYPAQAVPGPAEALAAVRAENPKLVLLDMNFTAATTGADGLALLAELKVLAPQVPVVLLTGCDKTTPACTF